VWWAGLFSLRNVARSAAGLLMGAAAFAFVYIPFTHFTALLCATALAGGGVVLVHTTLSARRSRTEALEFARTNGWTFEPQLSGLFAPLSTLPFTATEIAYTNVVTGRFGGFECFDGDFEWRKRIDKDTTISGRHRVAAVRMADELPRVMLVPEGLTSRLAKAFGGADNDFESSTFNREWRVLADDAKVAHDMLNPRVLARLESMATRAPLLFERGLGVRIDHESARIGSLADRLAGIIAVARFLPQHTVDDYGRLANSIGPLPSMTTPGALTGGYNPAILESDEEFMRTAKPRKAQKWIDAARAGEVAIGENGTDETPPWPTDNVAP